MSGSSSTDERQRRAALAQALFDPAAIALIGASSDPDQLGSRPARILRRYGFGGRVVELDALSSEQRDGEASVLPAELSAAIDHAYVMVPPQAVASTVRACGKAGVRVATVLSAGFAERGPSGRRRQEALLAVARAHGIRIVGPNSLGVVNVPGRVVLTANAVFEQEDLRAGALSVVSQSGSMLGAILTRGQERGLGFAKLLSVGNECDLSVGEAVELLVDDPATDAILLFLETLRDPPALAAAARCAYRAGKPVVAFKLGRSASGREAAQTHTGSIAGDDALASALFRAHGIVQVRVFEALFEIVPLLLGRRPPRRQRVCAVTVSGGAAAMVIDLLGIAGIEIAPPPTDAIERLAAQRVAVPSGTRVIDLPMGRADAGAYAEIVRSLRASDQCDLVLAVLGSNAAHDLQSTRDRIPIGHAADRPLAVFTAPRADAALAMLQDRGIAAFRTPESCADAIQAYCNWRAPREIGRPAPEEASALAASLPPDAGMLNAHRSEAILNRLGIAFAPSRCLGGSDEALDIAFPVAAKVLSADLPHKTQAGAVVLAIADAQALAAAVAQMRARIRAQHPHARIDGVLVQSMQSGLGELLIGYRRDPLVGPIVLVGHGGVHAELSSGHAVRLAPVDAAEAMEMLGSVPGIAALHGFRDLPRGDLDAVAGVIHRLSLLALAERVLEAEINPLLVRTDGTVALDARVRLA